jgi:cysteine desulfuration protein SufE
MSMLSDILEEYEFLDSDDRYRLLIELGRELPPMPDALKTEATWCADALLVFGFIQ